MRRVDEDEVDLLLELLPNAPRALAEGLAVLRETVQAQHPQLTIGVAHLAGAHPHHRRARARVRRGRVVRGNISD